MHSSDAEAVAPRTRRGPRIWGRRLLLLACILPLILLGLEATLRMSGIASRTPRWFDPEMGWRFYPNQVVGMRHAGIPLGEATIGPTGYRVPHWAPPHPTDGLAIACLGDSYTFGWLLADDEPWPARLQQRLDVELGSGRARVENFAVTGWNTVNQARQYPRDVRPWRPSVVLLGFCLNDTQPEDRGPRNVSGPLFHFARDTALLTAFHSYVRPRLPQSWFTPAPEDPELTRMRREFPAKWIEILAHPNGVGAPYWRRVDEALERLVGMARADGVQGVALIVFPNSTQVNLLRDAGVQATGDLGAVASSQRHLAAVAARLGIPILDLLPDFLAMPGDPFHPYDHGHPGAEAYVLTAQRVHELLQREGWLPAVR